LDILYRKNSSWDLVILTLEIDNNFQKPFSIMDQIVSQIIDFQNEKKSSPFNISDEDIDIVDTEFLKNSSSEDRFLKVAVKYAILKKKHNF